MKMAGGEGMPAQRRILERLVQRSAPSYLPEYRPAPQQIADGVWSLVRHLRIPPGPILPTRTLIVRANDDSLAIISPPPPHAETFAACEALGTVTKLVAPNSFHYLYVGAAAQRFPQAELLLAPGLSSRVPSLPPGTELPAAALADEFDQVVLDSRRGVCEVILHHRASRTLVLTDAAFNLEGLQRTSERIFWRLFGVPPTFGPSRTARLLLLPPKTHAAETLRQVLAWPFERIAMAHGEIVEVDARRRFEQAFAAYL